MTPREIIAEAWAITRREKLLRRWGYASASLETLLNVKLIGYQMYFLWAGLFAKKEVGFFDDFLWLYDKVPFWLFLTITISFGLLLLAEFLIPKIAAGSIIGLAAKAHAKQPVTGGLVLGLYNFFPILAIHEFLVLSGWALVVTSISFILRYVPLSPELRAMVIGIIIGVWALSNVLKLFFCFAEEAVVISKMSIFEAMGKSFKLLMSHLSHIMFLLLLLFVISLRILFNAATVLLIPAIIIGLSLLLTTVLSPAISYSIAGCVGLILIGAASYFFAYLHVFKQTVWTLTYMELKKLKDLDVIE